MSAADDETTLHVSAAVDGRAESLEWVVRRFSPALEAAAEYRMGEHLRRSVVPADVVGELWMIVLPRLGSLRPRDGRLTPVLMRYLATALRGHLNNLARRYARSRFLQLDAPAGEQPAADLPAEQTDAIERAARNEEAGRLRQALQQLAPSDRELIVRRAVEGERNVDVAESLGITPRTCATRYFRAMERLRSSMHGSVFDEIDVRS
jgi:RNA polymerase sigma factor (sigma-70 family)